MIRIIVQFNKRVSVLSCMHSAIAEWSLLQSAILLCIIAYGLIAVAPIVVSCLVLLYVLDMQPLF